MGTTASPAPLKSRLFEALQRFAAISLLFLPFIWIIRLWEFIALNTAHILPPGAWWFELLGLVTDLPLFLLFDLLLLFPFVLLFLLHKRTAVITIVVIFTLAAVIWALLIKYFITTLVPLDQVIFSYTIDEMIMITRSSTDISFVGFIPFLILIICIPLVQILFRYYRPGRFVVWSGALLLFASPLIFWAVTPDPSRFSRDFNYFLTTNKVHYLLKKTGTYQRNLREPEIPDQTIKEAIDRYQNNNKYFTYVSKTYPLLHADQTRDILGDYFALTPEKPNLVFIIVESLSSAFCGDAPWLGSWTPFLDSLINQSLYWQNCLATSERTFYVLPGMFGSLPYGNERFLGDPTKTSYHMSLIRYLRQNGWHTSFFYGGDPSFNMMKEFLTVQETDYLLEGFGKKYTAQTKAESGFTWGYPDHELFSRSFEVIDSFPQQTRMDIYLTLSMHAPFIPPSQAHYSKLFSQRLSHLPPGPIDKKDLVKYQNIFETILYTDDALRMFFKEYARRKEFNNTIFIITGDHALPELNIGQYSLLEKYRVPLIIYSPMLKKARRFPSVASHPDITPSLLAMLKDRYQLNIHPTAPWIGRELDTSSTFRPNVKMAFVLNNKDVNEYLDGQYYISGDRFLILTPEMDTDPVKDPAREEQMRKEFSDYQIVTYYAGNKNALVPFWMIFPEKIHEKPFPFYDTIMLPNEMNRGEYISVVASTMFDTSYKMFRLKVSYNMYTEEKELSKYPKLIFNILDTNNRHIVWRKFDVADDAKITPSGGLWKKITFEADINISFVKNHPDKLLKLYLWNQQPIPVRYDSLNVNLNGFY